MNQTKIGIDIVFIPQLEKICKRHQRFAERFFSQQERIYCYAKKNPLIHLGGKFAAKEAFIKASGIKTDFKNIEVLNHLTNSAPFINLPEKLNRWTNISLSISHSGDYATAIVLLTK